MFRGFPYIPPINSYTHPCRYCKGTARINGVLEGEHDCTSCNGTGIDGEPLFGCIAGIAAIAFVVALVVIFNWNR
jgi:hypothetical protein